MLGADINITYLMIWALALANIIGAGMCFLFARHLAKLTQIPFSWLAPFLIVAISFATLQVNRDPRDILMVLAFGMLGVAMKRFGFSRPAFLIGFVLQENLEKTLYQVTQLYSIGDFFTRPIVLVLSLIVALVIVRSVMSAYITSRNQKVNPELKRTRPTQIVLPALFTVTFSGALWMVSDMLPLGRMFPQVVAGIGLLAALWCLIQVARGAPSAMDDSLVTDEPYSVSFVRTASWVTGAIVSMVCFGFFAGASLFMAAFLYVEAKARIWAIALGIVGIMGIYLFLTFQAGTYLPDGWVLSLNPWDYF
ncbi:tripartite tricarboxylate transporter permease [Marinomonas sp. KJ51-3]|uniref:Tripartite tricarboxylate transporter permease n=2 Tax=Marinomonas TaxID=28253 RepID=A0ABT3KJ65_9GAMM|nr:tripartite tricarboxylate transporter permease [Marinomonas sp. KJ51-3]MCW4630583.1 tripartite tricarboxylate transporter permease [Marinomonas sp. KJ51-3]